jgi:hypothetical protein
LDTGFGIFLQWSHSCPAHNNTTDESPRNMPGWYVIFKKQQHIANIAGGVISENMSALTILTVFMDETKYGDYDRA